MDDPISCDYCHDILIPGDDYYNTPVGCYCPDCMDAMVSKWKAVVGEDIERI